MAKTEGRVDPWRLRITGRGTVAPGTLQAHPQNWREHPKAQARALASVLDEVGWVQQVVVNRTTGHIVDGHLRVELAVERGEQEIPVLYVELTEAEEATILAALDPLAGMATTNQAKLAELMAAASLSDQALRDHLGKLAGLTSAIRTGKTDPDELPAVRPTTIRPGDLFELGDHRLLCGDSTKAEDVNAVLLDRMPSLMVTDPPYGVNYDPGWRRRAGVNQNPDKQGPVANDDRWDWTETWQLSRSPVAYVWHGGLLSGPVASTLEAARYVIRSQIIWVKDRMALSRGDYHWKHEPCWYAVRSGASSGRTDDRTQTTVWEIAARDDSGHGHGTQKPVECMLRPLRNHDGDVYEPFAGTGTTVMAAEQLGRACYAIEIEPQYCQVTIDRWEAFTGKTARKVADGKETKTNGRAKARKQSGQAAVQRGRASRRGRAAAVSVAPEG